MEGGWEALVALIISTGSFLLVCYLLFYTRRNIDKITFEIRTHQRNGSVRNGNGDNGGDGNGESGTSSDG